MESLVLYVVLLAAFGLMLAGAYGAAPMLFTRRQARAHDGREVANRLFTLGAAFPLLEQDLAFSEPEPQTAAASVADLDRSESAWFSEDAGDEYRETSQPDIAANEPLDGELLNDLFAEIGMLRMQIEGLRQELGGLKSQAAAIAAPEAASGVESRRRHRSSGVGELPVSLRRRVSDVRRQRDASRSA